MWGRLQLPLLRVREQDVFIVYDVHLLPQVIECVGELRVVADARVADVVDDVVEVILDALVSTVQPKA